jgi:hypothetical protein
MTAFDPWPAETPSDARLPRLQAAGAVESKAGILSIVVVDAFPLPLGTSTTTMA